MVSGKTQQFLDLARVPKRYRDFDASLLPEDEAYVHTIARIREDLAAFIREGAGVLMWGAYSTGKTALACWLLKRVAEEDFVPRFGFTCLFVACREVATHIIEKTTFNTDQTLIERMCATDLLVLDELLLNGPDSFKDLAVEEVIRHRVGEKKSTIITTNYSPKAIKEDFPALAEPLRECCLLLNVKGKDFREAGAEELTKRWMS